MIIRHEILADFLKNLEIPYIASSAFYFAASSHDADNACTYIHIHARAKRNVIDHSGPWAINWIIVNLPKRLYVRLIRTYSSRFTTKSIDE